MNKFYSYKNGVALVEDGDGHKVEREYVDNLSEILYTENQVEVLENDLKELKFVDKVLDKDAKISKGLLVFSMVAVPVPIIGSFLSLQSMIDNTNAVAAANIVSLLATASIVGLVSFESFFASKLLEISRKHKINKIRIKETEIVEKQELTRLYNKLNDFDFDEVCYDEDNYKFDEEKYMVKKAYLMDIPYLRQRIFIRDIYARNYNMIHEMCKNGDLYSFFAENFPQLHMDVIDEFVEYVSKKITSEYEKQSEEMSLKLKH